MTKVSGNKSLNSIHNYTIYVYTYTYISFSMAVLNSKDQQGNVWLQQKAHLDKCDPPSKNQPSSHLVVF